MSDVMQQVHSDHPISIAWDAYKATPVFANTLKWCAYEQNAVGSLWGAFVAGFKAAIDPLRKKIEAAGEGLPPIPGFYAYQAQKSDCVCYLETAEKLRNAATEQLASLVHTAEMLSLEKGQLAESLATAEAQLAAKDVEIVALGQTLRASALNSDCRQQLARHRVGSGSNWTNSKGAMPRLRRLRWMRIGLTGWFKST